MAVTRSRPTAAIEAPVNVPPYERDPRFGSDVIVDVLRALNIEYVALNPGASYRGLHDSIVNYGGNQRPQLLLCNHEETAVHIAQGYYKATGRLMGAIVHNVVGLQHAAMAIFNAWCDRVPVLVLGGTGPMEAGLRRPWIDWIHTANLQGNLVRDFVKWDDQPHAIGDVPESLLRAYRTALTEPGGPVYVCFDAELQESPLQAPPPLPPVHRYQPAPPIPAPEAAIRQAAEWLVNAEWPVALADRLGRSPEAFAALQELASLLALPVLDGEARLNIPTNHPMNLTGAARRLLPEADVVIGLEMVDFVGATSTPPVKPARQAQSLLRPDARIINISLDELVLRAWAADYQRLPAADLPMLADVAVAVPQLLAACRELVERGRVNRERIARRAERLAAIRAELEAGWRKETEARWNDRPISVRRLMAEVYNAIKEEDWVLAVGRAGRLAPGIWEFREPRQHCGDSGGGGLGYAPGGAVGVALGLKGTGKLPVAIIGDGDFLMAPTALWTAVHYELPLLVVIRNNRSYYNDEEHQQLIAQVRNRPMENAWIGMRMTAPPPDMATIARGLGCWAAGPIEDPDALRPALERAVAEVRQGAVALVDVVCQPR
ncbi:MAG TPA: thiamine pyrophosphate-dependent enzyme [Chloroflexota bacterium]|nr:thiamine pyrophosphate-dependent enzyme [Chloroflexota bacterium]